MDYGLSSSVGVGGVNLTSDVKMVQTLLNEYPAWTGSKPTLKVDGKYGKNTRDAITLFQKNIVGMSTPDSRIDPRGQTYTFLTLFFTATDLKEIWMNARKKVAPKKTIKSSKKMATNLGLVAKSISYSQSITQDKRIVSNYTFEVIKMALQASGNNAAVITSTIRTPTEQASIMYGNASKDLKGQYDLYGTQGDKVLDVFKANKSKSKDDVIKLMAAKIEELAKTGLRVSKHCVTEEIYKTINVLDIGVNSTLEKNPGFKKKKFTEALTSLKKDGYISTLIDETSKVNSAWHIEVKVNKKPLQSSSTKLIKAITLSC